ncbi:iron ABC transporter ATP-binding protein [Agromyces sp. SYSU T00266]|uniref:iron ABC transporter ATP-binding protein n=1 Tax=Agromyces zhanjiangensis TaxID=3158562 RepID=UPI00339143DA
MPRPNAHRPRLRPVVLAAASATALALALSACTDPAASPAETSAPPAASGTAAATAPAEPTIEPEPTEEPIPFEVACEEILTADQVYAFNPNYGTAPDYAPSAATITDVVDASGTACGWSNQTSGEVIEVGVASLPEHAYELQVGDAAMRSNPVPTYGTPPEVEGFFRQSGGVGQAQVFADGYWIVVESPVLFEPGDAQGLVADVIANVVG